MDNNFNTIPDAVDSVSTPDTVVDSIQTQPVSSAFSDDSSQRLMNSEGQQIPQPYQVLPAQPTEQPAVPDAQPMQSQPVAPQYQPMPGQPVAPQYQPMQGQPVAPQYQPIQGQPIAPQYQPMQGQPVAPQYQPMQYQPMQYQPMPGQYQPVSYYTQYQQPIYTIVPPVPQPCTREARKLYRKHCSRVGWTAMADIGLMFAVQIAVIIIGAIGYNILYALNLMPQLDDVSLSLNLTMFAGGLSAIVGNLLPSSLHGRKWKIKFTDPFKGDKLKSGFILSATITAIGLNFTWGIIYNIIMQLISPESAAASESYTPYNMSPVALWLMVIWTCIIAPITEEYIFRGILMRTLSKYGATFGIVTSALMFGLMHGNLGQTPMTFIIGLVMGYVTAKSGNIRQAIFIHFVNNTFVTIPQVVLYYCPEAENLLNWIYLILEIGMVIFAFVALIRFAIIRSKGKKARNFRIAQGQTVISKEEENWIKLEIPQERLQPEFVLVKHKILHFATSIGMLVFISFCMLMIISDLLTYLV